MRWHGFREHLGDETPNDVEWGRPKPDPEPKPDQLDTAPVDWGVVIQSLINVAIAEERRSSGGHGRERRFIGRSWPGSSLK